MNATASAYSGLPVYRMGIDIGSVSAKTVILTPAGEMQFSDYRRHRADTHTSLSAILEKALYTLGDLPVCLMVTGSAGMGFSERYSLPFIQEVIASAEVIRRDFSQVRTLFDVGGEDAKMIFFEEGGTPDIRMNGSCAGGTGAYIDEMAALLNISLEELNALAEQHTRIYPMASRCGVFGKTDVQNLLSRAVPRPDIAASIFHAVVHQILATLARGLDLKPRYLFSGGPLTFLPALRAAFIAELQLLPEDVLDASHMELLPAWGAAQQAMADGPSIHLSQLARLFDSRRSALSLENSRLNPLFENEQDLKNWQKIRSQHRIERVPIDTVAGQPCFLGVDSGSTTSKLVLVDKQGRVAFTYYTSNRGNAVRAVQEGLEQLRQQFNTCQLPPQIMYSAATGYGEDLVRTAFGLDEGIIETLAHYRAAKAFDPQVSFILDIGGQDMKAIFVRNGTIYNIEVNEACSSGCGTFIETFAKAMGYGVADFAHKACLSSSPCDLGTRCTVFMNSRIKQALKEAAEISDVSAGLAYSVVKNSLYKVLKISDPAQLGEHIVVQGGTFKNQAVHRAFEKLTGREVICPDMAELMGAYGAALAARDAWRKKDCRPGRVIDLDALEEATQYNQRLINCRGCSNRCSVMKLVFPNKGVFFSGNRCERIYSNHGEKFTRGTSLTDRKLELLFERPTEPAGKPALTLGIPRVLNQYENFPFWCTLLVECGFHVQLSDPSTAELLKKGTRTVMSENICLPAKLAHAHIENLIEKGVDRIFYPMTFAEHTEFVDAFNSFNCPVVTGYPDVVQNAINPLEKHGIPLDRPAITFRDEKLLRRACLKYLARLGVKARRGERAFERALEAQRIFKEAVRTAGSEMLVKARAENRLVILLLSRPYHLDPLINHGIPQILVDLGVDVITEDAVPLEAEPTLDNRNVPTQWESTNRYYYAAKWAGGQTGVEVVQLNSFACGPDSYTMDEVKNVLYSHGKSYTCLRIDEVESSGSNRLRLRSLVDTLRAQERSKPEPGPRRRHKVLEEEDSRKVILTPHFSQFVSPAISGPFIQMGYQVETLPPPDRTSVEVGLRYAPNEICFPGIVIIGDLIKALQSGKHDPEQVVAGSWQTGGQCRATSILSMVRRALGTAGFQNVPILAISTTSKLHEQPGFHLNWFEYLPKAFLAIVYADAISSMYHATAVREMNAGQARLLSDELMAPLATGEMPLVQSSTLAKICEAVDRFNQIPTYDRSYPRVGIVGEIYVKYNAFSNYAISHWLMSQGIEPVLPPFLEFFLGWFVSNHIRVKEDLQRRSWILLLSDLLNSKIQRVLNQTEQILRGFKHHLPHHTIWDVAREARKIVSLTHAYGEGWLIAGETGLLVKNGTPNVLCLQPFGCIANQVVARGASRRLKEKYPKLKLLFMDIDVGMSEVNYFNRMHFFTDQAKSELIASLRENAD